MLVVAAGMQKSGTGWIYNLTNDLIVHCGGNDARQIRSRYRLTRVLKYANCNIDPPRTAKLCLALFPTMFGATYVVKSHHSPTASIRVALQGGMARAYYVYRDPRDVLVSAMEHGERLRGQGRSDTFARLATFEAALDALEGWVDIAVEWLQVDGVLTLRYEQFKADPAGGMSQLARHLSMRPSTAYLRDVGQSDSAADGEWEKTHFNQGKEGRFEVVLSPTQLRVLEDRLAPQMGLLGYPRQT